MAAGQRVTGPIRLEGRWLSKPVSGTEQKASIVMRIMTS